MSEQSGLPAAPAAIRHRWRFAVVLLASLLLAFLGVWASHGLGDLAGRMLLVGAHLVAVCFFGFALYRILRAILVRQASGDAIFGAVCGYLLLGIIWSLLYSAVETAFPGSFSVPAPPGADVPAARPLVTTASLRWPRWDMAM